MMGHKPLALVQEQIRVEPPLIPVKPLKKHQRALIPKYKLSKANALRLFTEGHIQQRDLTILNTIWSLGAVTAEHIRRLHFHTHSNWVNARNIANRRLRFLYDHYCLNRLWFRPSNTSPVYYLDIQGARLLQFVLEAKKLPYFQWRPDDQRKPIFFMAHRLEIVEFVTALFEAMRQQGGSLAWLGETTLSITLPDKRQFEPDGLGLLRFSTPSQDEAFLSSPHPNLSPSGPTLPIFLEWDRATKPVETVAAKLAKYHSLATSKNGQLWHQLLFDTFGLPRNARRFPLIIFVTITQQQNRLEKLMKAFWVVLKRLQVSSTQMPIWITSVDILNEHGLLGPSFFPINQALPADLVWDKGLVSLPDLGG